MDPETYLTYEIGSRFRERDVSVNASVFYTDMSDAITRTPIGTVAGTGEVITAPTNGADGYLWGGEVEGAMRLNDEFTANGMLSYVDGEVDTFLAGSLTSVREPVSRLMPLTGSVAVRWQQPRSDLWIGARVTAVARGGPLSTRDRGDTSRIPPSGTPGYVHVMLNSGYRASDNFELFLTLDNVTDIDYRVHGSGINEPGINVILGGKYSW